MSLQYYKYYGKIWYSINATATQPVLNRSVYFCFESCWSKETFFHHLRRCILDHQKSLKIHGIEVEETIECWNESYCFNTVSGVTAAFCNFVSKDLDKDHCPNRPRISLEP